MRRDLVVMGTLAAIAGIALAAMLTASFGASSSGPPARLKPVVETSATKADPPKAAVKTKPRPHNRRRHHHAHKSAPATPAQGATSLADAQQPATIKPAVQHPQHTRPTQQVRTPAPAPQPVRPLGRPTRPKKGGSGGGGTFDDSG